MQLDAWLFFGLIFITYVSLFISIWRVIGVKELSISSKIARSLLGAFVLTIPVFYLFYLGMIPKGEYHILVGIINYGLPVLWAHLVVASCVTAGGKMTL